VRRAGLLLLLLAAGLAPAFAPALAKAPVKGSGEAGGAVARLCDGYSGLPAAAGAATGPAAGMVWIEGGGFRMGSDRHFPEEGPSRRAEVGGFWIDRHEVTNAQFARFVAATGYRTVAELGLSAEDYPDLPPEALVPGSMVFYPVTAPGQPWWDYVPGADWRHPEGPGSSLAGRENHPVVHVAYLDALAYADWLGRALPSEAEWEFAARGGLEGRDYSWGDEPTPEGRWMANSWQGFFPYEDEAADGHHGTAPVGCYPPNGYGLFDMAGNVWEWAADGYRPDHRAAAAGDRETAVRVIKGGSWLCAPDFCMRFRPAARQPQEADLGTSHVGFRTVLRGAPPTRD